MGRSGGREKRLKMGGVSRSQTRMRDSVPGQDHVPGQDSAPVFNICDQEEIKNIYNALLEEDFSPEDHFELAEMAEESNNPAMQLEGVFHQKHGIEVMLDEVTNKEDLPEELQKTLLLIKTDLENQGIDTGKMSFRDMFVAKRFLDNFNSDPKSRSANKLKENRNPLEILKKAAATGNMKEVEHLSVAFEGAEATAASESSLVVEEALAAVEEQARAGATLFGREPDADIVVLPSDRWEPSSWLPAVVSGGAIHLTTSFAKNTILDSGSLSVISAESVAGQLLGDEYEDDIPDASLVDGGELKDLILRVAQHELIHASQGGMTNAELVPLPAEESGFILSFTESLTEGYNLKVLGESLTEAGDGAVYLPHRQGLSKIFKMIGVDESEEKDLLEKLNYDHIQETITFLDQELIRRGEKPIRDIWIDLVGEAKTPENFDQF